MVANMTFMITSVNIGWQAGFMGSLAKTFAIIYDVGTHITYIFAPISHKWTAQMVGGTGIEPVTPTASR
jgi:type IV secretory pathway VirB2 component (pilin)